MVILKLTLFLAFAGAQAQDIDVSKIHFFLWTSENPTQADTIQLDEGSLQQSHFNPENPIIILAHGWNSNGLKNNGKGYGADFADDYFAVGDFNLFSIDWGDLESWANYPHAAAITKPVGEHAALLVELLLTKHDVLENIHLVGHSLGAHVVGFIAKTVQSMGLGKIKQITGLDPAYPFFELHGPEGRIDKSDAEFVQIIHTNSGFLWDGCLSFKAPLGHVDFYPEGGDHQPGCDDLCFINCAEIPIIDLIRGGCSHERANSYFAESIHGLTGSDEFIALQCDSWDNFQAGNCCGNPTATMGQWVDTSMPEGSYFFNVNRKAPFAMDISGNGC